MSGPIGVGVIGAGVISTQYLENLTTAADTHVVMVADLDLERAAARAREYGVGASGTPAELLAREDIEIVVNLTIPAAHVPVSLEAIAAGKHVWSEKPLALDRQSGARLMEAARAAGLRVACAPDTVLGAGVQTARRMLEAGVIGEPLTAMTLFETSGPESWHPNPEFLYAKGGGPLFDMGPYYLSTLVQLLGPIGGVVARANKATETRRIGSGPKAGQTFPVEVPTHLAALIDFRRGISGISTFSFQSPRPRVGVVEITGTSGTLVLPDPNTFEGTIHVWRDGMREEAQAEAYPAVGSTFSRGAGVVDLARAIREGRPERASGDVAFHVLDIMVSIAESAERGERVAVESTVEVPPALPEAWDPVAATI